MEIRVGPATVTIHTDDKFLVCERNAEMSSTEEHGYFAADTRLVSGYRLKLGRKRPVLLNAWTSATPSSPAAAKRPAFPSRSASSKDSSWLSNERGLGSTTPVRHHRTPGLTVHPDSDHLMVAVAFLSAAAADRFLEVPHGGD